MRQHKERESALRTGSHLQCLLRKGASVRLALIKTLTHTHTHLTTKFSSERARTHCYYYLVQRGSRALGYLRLCYIPLTFFYYFLLHRLLLIPPFEESTQPSPHYSTALIMEPENASTSKSIFMATKGTGLLSTLVTASKK